MAGLWQQFGWPLLAVNRLTAHVSQNDPERKLATARYIQIRHHVPMVAV